MINVGFVGTPGGGGLGISFNNCVKNVIITLLNDNLDYKGSNNINMDLDPF